MKKGKEQTVTDVWKIPAEKCKELKREVITAVLSEELLTDTLDTLFPQLNETEKMKIVILVKVFKTLVE